VRQLTNISGDWRGTYFFDHHQWPPEGGGVDFVLSLSQGRFKGVFGRFAGFVTEDATRGVPGQGRIEGVCRFPGIRFVKHMPSLYVVTDGCLWPYRQYLLSLGCDLRYDTLRLPILYQGNFDDPTHAKGRWIIEGRQFSIRRQVSGNPRRQEVTLLRTTGTWILTR
jgi:hypothetical protein